MIPIRKILRPQADLVAPNAKLTGPAVGQEDDMTESNEGGVRVERTVSRGDYVLATKYLDGDPQDQWAVGFLTGMLPKAGGDRFMVADTAGNQFRGNGFRRIKKISAERGEWLLAHKQEIETGARSVWWWVRQRMNG